MLITSCIVLMTIQYKYYRYEFHQNKRNTFMFCVVESAITIYYLTNDGKNKSEQFVFIYYLLQTGLRLVI